MVSFVVTFFSTYGGIAFYHFREQGIQIKNLDMRCGDITVNLSENLFAKTKLRSDDFTEAVPSGGSRHDIASGKLSQNNKLSSMLKKQIILFPDKVCDLFFPCQVLYCSLQILHDLK